jgi:hypothetical protein
MNEREAAKLFCARADAILAQSEKAEEGRELPFANAEDIELARALAEADFSRSSAALGVLKTRIPAEVVLKVKDRAAFTGLLPAPAPFASLVAVAAAAAAVLACGTFSYLALSLPGRGNRAESVAVASAIVSDLPTAADDSAAAVLAPGLGADARFYESYNDAKKAASFPIKAPGYLPQGYRLEGIYVGETGTYAILIFARPGSEKIVISQVPADNQVIAASKHFSPSSARQDGGIEPLPSVKRVLVAAESVSVDGIVYSVSGASLEAGIAARISRSFE